jgi:uncharacterized protein YcbK (DUF882 family)
MSAAEQPGTEAGYPFDDSRRRLVRVMAVSIAAPALLLSKRTLANVPRALAFTHTHTGEHLALTYAHGDQYVPSALAAVKSFLRDFRNGETHDIDPQLLDRLHAVASVTCSRQPFQVISGYRSPTTNRALHVRSRGVAEHSLHIEGKAIDVRLADVRLADLRDAALSLNSGGVGFYPAADSDFVHIDTGRTRRW